MVNTPLVAPRARSSAYAFVSLLLVAMILASCSQSASPPKTPTARVSTALGVDIWWIKKAPFKSAAAIHKEASAIVDYVVEDLHANSLSVSFPLFVKTITSSKVFATSETPSPANVRTLIRVARASRLRVVLRPLLNVDDKKGYTWRGFIDPPRRIDFFRSYAAALRPYLELAQVEKEPTFVYSTELFVLSKKDPAAWNYFIQLLHQHYRGALVYDSTAIQYYNRNIKVPGYSDAVDAYFSVKAGPRASVALLERGYEAYFIHKTKDVLRRTVLYEVGINAVPTGYSDSQKVDSGHTQYRYLFMQRRWFTMVCRVVHHLHLAGIYFWNLFFNTDPQTVRGHSPWLSPTVWVARPGARAVTRCFRSFRASRA